MADLTTPVLLLGEVAVPTAGAAPVFSVRLLPPLTLGPNTITGGSGQIPGNVYRDSDPTDVPLRRRVYLHRQRGGLMVQEQWSDATTGAYLFTDIDPTETYYVVAFDYTHDYRAVIADNLTPEVLA